MFLVKFLNIKSFDQYRNMNIFYKKKIPKLRVFLRFFFKILMLAETASLRSFEFPSHLHTPSFTKEGGLE